MDRMISNIKNKKGQVQMGESVAVVVIVLIMLIIGIAFWSRISARDVEKISENAQDHSIVEIANTVSELPELKCFDSDVYKVKCLDYHKIQAMSNLSKNATVYGFYNDYFKNSKITVQIMYPHSENITIYDAKLSNNTKTLLIPIPINVRDYINRTTFYGLIVVEGYYNG